MSTVYTVTWINPNDKEIEHAIFAEESDAKRFYLDVLSQGIDTVRQSDRPIKEWYS